MEEQGIIMVEQRAQSYLQEHTQLAFRHEFYERATDNQIRDDVVSYLAEYRFKVHEFDYKLGVSEGKLVDPNSGDSMTSKAQKAIDTRKEHGLKTTRERAELEGLFSLESQLRGNPTGNVLWLSPPGEKKDGYGDYGFAFLGERDGDDLKMTAIRLEDPSIDDFNVVAETLWNRPLESAEDFLRNPVVLDIGKGEIKDFVIGTFEILTEENKKTFDKALSKMENDGIIGTFTNIVKSGNALERQQAINAIENLAIELNDRFSSYHGENVVFLQDYKKLEFYDAMQMQRYVKNPPPVAGSCGMSGKIESSNFLGKLLSPSENGLNKSNQEWFTCPKCTYKADGPVGNKCPGCGLTKEQFVEDGGENCD